eukprot:SAG25_NODE_1956_length_2101_cov_21.696304_2_plen_148_part_00
MSEHPSATTCEAGQLKTAIAEINTQCCGADDAACVNGLPRSCDAGCAKVFLPFWDSCGWELGSAEEYASVIALCEARVADEESGNGDQAYECTCAEGWRGLQCENPTGCEHSPCGPHGTCTADGGSHHCTCEAGYSKSQNLRIDLLE